MEYIKWLSINDLALGIQLKKMDEILKGHIEGNESAGINEIIELFVVCKYMDAQIYPSIWNETEIDGYKKIVKKFKGIVGKYFNTLCKDEFHSIYNGLDRDYRKLFWEAFRLYKLYEKIEFSYIKDAIGDKMYAVRNILLEKSIVDAYGEEIRKELLAFEKAAEWLLDEYEVHHEFEREHLYFPKELKIDDKKEIIKKYVEWEEANLNYLQIIVNIQDNPDTLVIGDRLRLQTRKRVEKEQEKLFSRGGSFKTEINVIFGELKENDSGFDMDSHKIVCKYDSNWIKENLDEPTLLNNFIYWFGYVDMQWRITLVEKDVHKGIVEKFLFMHSK